MTTYTTNLGLALPVTGDLTGTWGQTVNDAITTLLDSAVAGTTTISADADVTLTDTTGATNQARQAIIRWTAGGTVTRNITAPARTKVYVVINATSGSQSIVFRGAGPTAGVTLVAGERCVVAWSGTDFVKVASTAAGDVVAASNNAFTGANTFYNATGQTFGTGTSTQDGIIVAGRAGGSSSYRVTLAPGTLTASRSVTFPDAAGAVVLDAATQTLTNKTLTDPAIVGTILEDVYTISDGAAFEIDPGNGSIQLITLGANRTPKATNFAAGEAITLMVDDGSAYTITWTDATFGGSGVVWKTDGGNAPTLNTTGYTAIVLWKVSTQVYGARVGNA